MRSPPCKGTSRRWPGGVRLPVSELLGRTRAAVLRHTARERTTTELGVGAGTVSGHTKALRAAGLIVTARAGMLHSLTPLGSPLLEGAGQPAARRGDRGPDQQPHPRANVLPGSGADRA